MMFIRVALEPCRNREIKVVLDVHVEGVVRFDLWSELFSQTAANVSVSTKWMKPTAHCLLIGFFRLTEIRCPSSYNNSFWLIQDLLFFPPHREASEWGTVFRVFLFRDLCRAILLWDYHRIQKAASHFAPRCFSFGNTRQRLLLENSQDVAQRCAGGPEFPERSHLHAFVCLTRFHLK